MDRFATKEADGHERHIDGRRDTNAWPYLDFTFDPRLTKEDSVSCYLESREPSPLNRMERRPALTMVAEIPGYPIRKLPFAGPETRTKAAISIAQFPHHHGHAAEKMQ